MPSDYRRMPPSALRERATLERERACRIVAFAERCETRAALLEARSHGFPPHIEQEQRG